MSKYVSRGRRIALAVASVTLLPSVNAALAADGTWGVDAAGTWHTATNWSGSTIADGTDATANFTFDLTVNRTVTIDGAVASRTLGTINFSDPIAGEGGPPPTFKQYTIAASNAGTLTLATSTGTPTLSAATVSHTLNLPVIGTQGLTKTGEGTVIFGQNNPNLTGPIVVNAGTLRTNSVGGFNNQPITVANGALAYHNPASGVFASNYTVAGDGPTEGDLITRLGAIRFAGQSQSITGSITLTGDTGISSRGSVTATPATISGQITGGFGLRLGRTSTTTSVGNGFLVLSNTANNWGGTTTIEDGTVRLGASNVIPNGAAAGNVVMHNLGTNTVGAINDSVLELNGNNERINGLSHSGGTALADQAKLRVINGHGSIAAMLTLGDNNAAGNFGGSLQNGGAAALGLTKVGAAIQNLSGANTYTGDTFIQGGTLSLTSATSNNNIGSSARIVVGDSVANNAARLDVNGITTAGGFQVPTGQTLMGHGTVAGGATINAGAIINPGNGVGTLTRQGNTVLAGALKVDFDGTGIDVLDNTGSSLDIGAGTVDFDATAGLTDQAYVFAKYGSLLGSSFANVQDLPSGYTIDYNYLGGNQIALVAVPEPSGLILLGAGCLALASRRRRQ